MLPVRLGVLMGAQARECGGEFNSKGSNRKIGKIIDQVFLVLVIESSYLHAWPRNGNCIES